MRLVVLSWLLVASALVGWAPAYSLACEPMPPLSPDDVVTCWGSLDGLYHEVRAFFKRSKMPSQHFCNAFEALRPKCYPEMFSVVGYDLRKAKWLKTFCDAIPPKQ
ncbi:hypothetical protein AMTR_s00032p00113070 [Amborella trichopoda]|uniref:Prolamin-like domain-containing protein n=1 Tax=Amborella trichopoda TaxID=13333 RepID=U5CNU2_AMBTC|nr:hypothetical protein AMTR_s00032p00113070 [Amborella trichopoda]